ncbi:MAG: hypothetical protein HY820_13100 [Acidobacteria bacterium]|nr:hypothetical protein [Acidobacteriota bacterium]
MPARSPAQAGLEPLSVGEQLARILSASQFSSSSRMRRFLSYCVEQTLNGNQAALKEYSIGLEVFDRGPDFDPRLNSIVRVEAQRLRRKLCEYYHGEGAKDSIVIEFLNGSYAPVFRSTPPRYGRRTRLAVLPFANLSPELDSDYFADGLTEELTSMLSRVACLAVVARSSSFVFKGLACDLGRVGEVLGVSAVVEGSVRRSGDRLRITARLIEIGTGIQLWSSSYDSCVGDRLAIEDEIVRRICTELCSHIGGFGVGKTGPGEAG